MKILLLCIIAISLTACGINDNLEKVTDNMETLNKKLSTMNTNIEVMKGNTSTMSVSIGVMSDSLSSTKNSIHSQSLMLAQNEMLKYENTKYLSLGGGSFIPMLPSSQAFATMLSADELAGIGYIYLSEINVAQIDTPLNAKQKAEYDLGKYIKLTALELIAGLAPQATIDAMVKSQIIDGGAYTDAAYAILVLRNIVVKDILLEQLVGDGRVKLNKTQQETANSYRKTLDIIQHYPFFDKLTVKLYGFYTKDLNQTLKVERTK